ncbi:diguanylate cyclase domain-containing protein, partial [Kineococcus glutinatus]|uniref:GGDEF domain-containing protein n=1 Tax=Kineococcus glutinatus TaxID=1070872 RepID=UPI003CD0B977
MRARAAVARLLRRPTGLVDRTRWLLGVLLLAVLLLSLPAPLAGGGAGAALALASCAVLAGVWATTYLTGRARTGPDVAEVLAVGVLALSAPSPALVLGLTFSSLWFRALHGSTARTLAQCLGYGAALAAAVLCADVLPHHREVDPLVVLGPFPVMLATAVVARRTAAGMIAREAAARRDGVLVELGTRLLGATDAAVVLAEAHAATAQLCRATPGLRVLAVVPEGGQLSVRSAAGPLHTVPARLPGAVLTGDGAPGGSAPVGRTAELDAAAGQPCRWVHLVLPGTDVHLLAGAPGRVPAEVLVCLRTASGQVALALAAAEQHRELRARTRTDDLPGLANRAGFHEELAAAAAGPGALAVLYADLDGFKGVNDRLGHAAGDEVLRHVGRLLQSTAPTAAVCARLGGDEFAALLRGAGAQEAPAVGRELVRLVTAPLRLPQGTARVGLSIGVAHA